MPEVLVALRWPDGEVRRCTSPSTAIERHLVAGAAYPVDELVRRMDAAMAEASARVRARFGFACTAADAAARDVRDAAAACGPNGRVVVERLARGATRPRFPAPARLDGHVPVVVVGGGQAGLATSYELRARGVEHLVLERERIGHRWTTQRWDTFCLVTPNFQCRLPGWAYTGPEPQGFMLRDEILDYVRGFADAFSPPVHEGLGVDAIRPAGDRFAVATTHGTITADHVVLAVGGYHAARRPRLAGDLPGHVAQLHSSTYRNPTSLPDGAVLVVGSGQSGGQIAEDLHLAGRDVHLAVGSAPRVARRHRGRDVVAWLEDMGHYDRPVSEHPEGPGARHEPNHYVTGRGGGRDIDLRALSRDGMALHGRLTGVHDGGLLCFAGDLRANLDAADATYARINGAIDAWIADQRVTAPPGEPYVPGWAPPATADHPSQLRLEDAGITSVVWATGFTQDWSWVELPGFAPGGEPVHERGVTEVDGLSVVGLPWLHTWGSGRFASVARDAAHLAEHVADRLAPALRAAS